MPTPQRCIAQAQEAERLAAVVSYERDRERLMRQAAEWRAEAAELEAGRTASGTDEGPASEPRRRAKALLGALFGPRRTRGG